MKYTILKIAAAVLFVYMGLSLTAQQWYRTNTPRSRVINSIVIPKHNSIIVGGGNEFNDSIQALFYTEDFGITWEYNQADSVGGWIRSVAMYDTVRGWAVGYDSKLMYTNEGGHQFHLYPPPPVNRSLNSVVYASDSTMYIAGGWRDTIATVLKSINGGQSWTVSLDTAGTWLKDIYFFNEQTGIAVGDSSSILRTTDGGATWAYITAPVLHRNFNAITFFDATTGIIAGGTHGPDSMRTILRTTDGGLNWNVIKDEAGDWLRDVYFLDNQHGYIVGANSQYLTTTNGGISWTDQVIPTPFPEQFNTVYFYNNGFGAVGCHSGNMYVYTTSVLPDVITDPVSFIDTSRVIFKGRVNTHDYSGQYYFELSDDAMFTTITTFWPSAINSNTLQPVQEMVHGLITGNTYYYRCVGRTLAGNVNGNTQSFTLQIPGYAFDVTGATVTPNTATLTGFVNKLPVPLHLNFEYGENGTFYNSIPAIPDTVGDTLPHNLTSLTVYGLQPQTRYNARLRGWSLQYNNIYSDTFFFTTDTIFSVLQTNAATNISGNTAQLNGFVTGCNDTVSAGFICDTSQQFFNGTTLMATPGVITDNGAYNFTALAINLLPNTTYYYKAFVSIDSAANSYANTQSFTTGANADGILRTLTANIQKNAAQLKATVSNFSVADSFYFTYGTTLAMNNTLAASPATVTTTLAHTVSAVITNLQPNTLYYYAINAKVNNAVLRGNIKQLYTGTNEIPNWDFSDWTYDTVPIPDTWLVMTKGVERAPGYTGNYGIKLTGKNMTLLGLIGDRPRAGQYFPHRPDSIIFYANYRIDANDEAYAMIALMKGDSLLSFLFNPITGNSNGNYARIATAIDYSSPTLVPDSLTILFFSTRPNFNSNDPILPHPNNVLMIDDISFSPPVSTAVINGDFERWKDLPVEEPGGWYRPGYAFADTVGTASGIRRVLHKAPDDYAVEMQNIERFGNYLPFSISTEHELMPDSIKRFPVYAMHQTLNGYYQHYPVPGDTTEFRVRLYKNGKQVGAGYMFSGTTASTYTPFEIQIEYAQPYQIPDSASIRLAPSREQSLGKSKMIIDKLHFDGYMNDDFQIPSSIISATDNAFRVYPNPNNGRMIVELKQPVENAATIQLVNLNGQIIYQTNLQAGQNKTILDAVTSAEGLYVLRLTSGSQVSVAKVVINK